MNVHFILAERPVTRENVDSFGPDVTVERLDQMTHAINEVGAEVRCAQHDRAAKAVVCRGGSLPELDFEVTACCVEFASAFAGRLRLRIRPERILRPEQDAAVKTTWRYKLRRFHRAFGPILAGLVIDSVDLLSFGPMKRFVGFPVGALAGYWMGSIFKLPQKQRLLCALAAGIYCFIPGLEFIPVATLIGAYVRFRESGDPE